MKKTIFGLIAFIGLLILFGTAGASDNGVIHGVQVFIQAFIGILLTAAGLFMWNVFDIRGN